ncbi:MAG TPA: type IV pili methyl-accepting chemotaxis transducer N-terminal domain-containing protein [Gammaproteobacteria bacterium]|nr:type IV pili methyl-accepting chemotaxis transducer N-terminal domain-containing protein [Gammaproteobacteria bacterium]
MDGVRQWNLGVKLALVGTPFIVLALFAVALTLWVSWQLDGGAAAVNEAGRMRMQTYRMSLSIDLGKTGDLAGQVAEFERSLELLRVGDPLRPLFVPWDANVHARYAAVERRWQAFRERWASRRVTDTRGLREDAGRFVAAIDALVSGIEFHMSRWTALMHLVQTAMMALVVIGAAIFIYTGYLFVLEPLGQLKRTMERFQAGDFNARVDSTSHDEFDTLAQGFNGLADHLQQLYRSLEAKVVEKTAELEEKGERLRALYGITALVANATSLDALAQGFVERVRAVAHADGVALRWADESSSRYLLLASEGLPSAMIDGEHCVQAGSCHCAAGLSCPELRVTSLHEAGEPNLHCVQAGFATVVSIPVRHHERLMGEVDLFFHAWRVLPAAERSLLEALAAHLAGAMENLRLYALEKEAAIAQERTFIARELHDSIAQSLAFLKIQVQLMRDALRSGDDAQMAAVLEEVDTGVRECYGDVRELLMHFRTRANAENLEAALQTTLRKFEHQSGLPGSLATTGQGLPLAPDVQVQVLHIVQEALSNVRKHAGASRVWIDVQQQPRWRFEIRDDGVGFDPDGTAPDETHVGLRIMHERAERIGAELEVFSHRGRGCSVVLTLPPAAAPQRTAA